MAQLQQSQIGGSGDRTQKPVEDEACRSVPYWLVTVEDFVVISARELLATDFHWHGSDGC
jgi:hypothetical protein